MDDDAARNALRRIPYGLYVCTTTRPDGGHHAFVLSWTTQVSFKPRLVAIGVNTQGRAHDLIEGSRVFCINMFPQDSEAIVRDFFQSKESEDDSFAGHGFTTTDETGTAVLDEASAWLECRVRSVLDIGGDHEVIVGEVVEAGTRGDEPIVTHASTGLHYAG